jgi:hypothetical protein
MKRFFWMLLVSLLGGSLVGNALFWQRLDYLIGINKDLLVKCCSCPDLNKERNEKAEIQRQCQKAEDTVKFLQGSIQMCRSLWLETKAEP